MHQLCQARALLIVNCVLAPLLLLVLLACSVVWSAQEQMCLLSVDRCYMPTDLLLQATSRTYCIRTEVQSAAVSATQQISQCSAVL
jgi:hypothetical protein